MELDFYIAMLYIVFSSLVSTLLYVTLSHHLTKLVQGPKPQSQNASHCPNAGTGIWVNADLDRHFDWHLDIHLYQ